MSDEDYIYNHARREMERLEAAKRKRLAQSQQSFGDWLMNSIEKVGRALGQIISVPVKIISNIWSWLFG
ncbi:MAG: hypothetical protein AB7O73_12685 [Bacteroidia bacterium]